MKLSLRSQVRSWLAGRNGLVSNTTYHFHTWSATARAVVKAKFGMSSYGTTNGGSGVPGRVNTAGTALHVRSGASLSASIVGSVSDGSYVSIHCQKHGGAVTGTYGTSTLWDKIGAGYVSDAYISTGSDGQVAQPARRSAACVVVTGRSDDASVRTLHHEGAASRRAAVQALGITVDLVAAAVETGIDARAADAGACITHRGPDQTTTSACAAGLRHAIAATGVQRVGAPGERVAAAVQLAVIAGGRRRELELHLDMRLVGDGEPRGCGTEHVTVELARRDDAEIGIAGKRELECARDGQRACATTAGRRRCVKCLRQ